MQIITTITEMRQTAERLRQEDKIIGFVPTMGYLHEGHLSLLRIAKQKSDVTVMSVFVNPTQFGPNEDLDRYPRDFARDEKLAATNGCDIVFYPSVEEMYPQPYHTYVNVEEITTGLCGASRPGFFSGVTTVVAKLFNIVKPHLAVFGQKDAQQAIVVRQMVHDLNFDLEIIVAPIIREPDGLAMSSRNAYLSQSERQEALVLYKALMGAQKLIKAGERNVVTLRKEMEQIINTASSAQIDYIAIVDAHQLREVSQLQGEVLIALAVWIGSTRLIDNLMITV